MTHERKTSKRDSPMYSLSNCHAIKRIHCIIRGKEPYSQLSFSFFIFRVVYLNSSLLMLFAQCNWRQMMRTKWPNFVRVRLSVIYARHFVNHLNLLKSNDLHAFSFHIISSILRFMTNQTLTTKPLNNLYVFLIVTFRKNNALKRWISAVHFEIVFFLLWIFIENYLWNVQPVFHGCVIKVKLFAIAVPVFYFKWT